ncbi:hypothetical protein H6F41_14595 [Pseudanabaena sp. FACHB-723]|uniref:Uncharacterized protein n=2 Tax=Pseudanabaena mucicola TaxID=71190 RepID=A0ABR7ZZP3_9CYAN|nr:hypothetical protein [Pseudanabaena mucicola FACHB-723]
MLQTIEDNFTMKFLYQLANEDIWQKETCSIKSPQEFLRYIAKKLNVDSYLVNEDDLTKAVNLLTNHEKDKEKFFKAKSPMPNLPFVGFYKSPISDMANYHAGWLTLSNKLREQLSKL